MTRLIRLLALLLLSSTTSCRGFVRSVLVRDEAILNLREHAEPLARYYSEQSPVQRRWAASTGGAFAENAWSTSRGLLASLMTLETVGVNMRAQRPQLSELVLYDAVTGKRVWSRPRPLVPVGGDVVIATEPALIVRESRDLTRYVWLDLSSGRELGRITVQSEHELLTAPDRDRMVLGETSGSQVRLRVLEATTGRLLRTIEHSARGDGSFALLLTGSQFLVAGSTLSAFDLATGQPAWQLPLELAPTLPAAALPHGLLCNGSNGELWALDAAGARRWRMQSPGRKLVAASASADLIVLFFEEQPPRLAALSTLSGRVEWSRLLPDGLVAGPVLAHGRVFVSDQDRVLMLDPGTGSELGTAPLPASLVRERLPERLLPVENGVVFQGEGGVGRLDVHTGKFDWFFVVPGDRLGTARAEARFTAALARERGVDLTDVDSAASEAEARMRRFNASLEAFRDSSRQMIGRLETFSPTVAREVERLNAGTGVALAGMQVQQAMLELGMQHYLQAFRERAVARILHAWRLHQHSLQGNYFVRPFSWTWGQGVLIVDVRSGRWLEVVTGPAENGLHDHYPAQATAAIDPSGALLVTEGLGLDAKNWIGDDRYPDVDGLLHRIVAYDTSAGWRSAAAYPRASITRSPASWPAVDEEPAQRAPATSCVRGDRTFGS